MAKIDSKNLVLGLAWGTGITVVLAFLTLIAGSGTIPRWGIIALGIIGFLSFLVAFGLHGWLIAPHWLGTPLRFMAIMLFLGGAMAFLCWLVWPPIRRHALSQEERASFKRILLAQNKERDQVQIACPERDEVACAYATQYIDIVRECGWNVTHDQVDRVTLARPHNGVVIVTHSDTSPVWPSGVWQRISPSLVSFYLAFQELGIETDTATSVQVPNGSIAISFGPEKADESEATPFTKTMNELKEKGLVKQP
jgi:hypothetical protein